MWQTQLLGRSARIVRREHWQVATNSLPPPRSFSAFSAFFVVKAFGYPSDLTAENAKEITRRPQEIGGATSAALHYSSPMNRITIDSEQCGGRPGIRGMRIRVTDVLDLLSIGLTSQQVLEDLPDLELADIQACLQYASRKLNHPVLVAA